MAEYQPLPADAVAWLALWEASLRDPGNDELAAVAGSVLLEILADRGIDAPGTQRPESTTVADCRK